MFGTVGNECKRTKIYLLDGGMGTTLESIFHKDVSSPLWSAKPVDEEPEVIIDAHLAFLHAGADVILTSTYQCAYSTFASAGYSHADAVRIMRKAVHLAHEARTRYCQHPSNPRTREIKIVLALGPFGATLSPTQEFDGFYPPPYGPPSNEAEFQDHNGRPNSFTDAADELRAMEALAEFHAERLHIFASDRETWDLIDGIAFETIPLTREIRAVRKAIEIVRKEGLLVDKPWWISTLYPDGKFPERKLTGEHVSVGEVVDAMLAGDEPNPHSIGVNCTGMIHLDSLLDEMARQVKSREVDLPRKPSLVVYPNGGDVWNPESKRWQEVVADGGEKARTWAREIEEKVRLAESHDLWPEILAGGCCRTGPAEISALSRRLRG
ncbi:Homocysteine S-methyltransferase [Cristinia sonorae]|uniref:Homocysteine S-methyltransferase n=1 Tax=Cristinia sonorae TaxID=1940300 RepID=A0A8K0UYE6_9AGAR|nr:Homocysteine S-methyltransferase [Cristinia sonorae]